jgi:hypothetical protein
MDTGAKECYPDRAACTADFEKEAAKSYICIFNFFNGKH